MTDSQFAQVLVEKVADAHLDKKIAVFVNRLMLRLHSQPAFLSNLADVAVFKPGVESETTDQVEDGEFNEEGDGTGKELADAPRSNDEEESADESNVILQLSFRRLPQEVVAPLIRLIGAPRDPKLMRYTKDGSARIGVEIELKPDDFPGDEYDYTF